MSIFPSALCSTGLTNITSLDILQSLSTNTNTNGKITVINSLGLTADPIGNIASSSIDIPSFYTWWKDPLNSENLATIINTIDITSKTCLYLTQYNNYLMRIFFCNNSPTQNFSPRLEGTSSYFISQLDNLHYYLANHGGGGLGFCTPIDDKPPTAPLLQSFCSDITPNGQNVSQFISGNPKYYKWCGCYAQPSEFSEPFVRNFDQKQKLACNPLCNYYDSIGLYEQSGTTNYQKVVCSETICVIDDITIKVVDSEGKIDFNQICKGCDNAPGNCLCIIDTSVKGILDKINVGDRGSQDPASFTQVCPGAQCYSVDAKGVYTKLKCNPNNNAYTNQDPFFGYNGDGFLKVISDEDKLNDNDYMGIFIIVTILIMFLIVSFIGLHDIDRKIKKQEKNIPHSKPKMSFELNPKYKSGSVKPFNKTRYAPLN